MKKCCVFIVKSSFGRFRKPYTTTSALTYTIIHPVAVRGLIGAVLGIDKDKLYDYTKDLKVGVQVLSKIQKDMQSFNLINMKTSDKIFRFPSNIEFLRNPFYRIFIAGQEEKIKEICRKFSSGNFVFTPYLGASEHIAKITFEGEFDIKPLSEGKHSIHTAIPIEDIDVNLDKEEYIINVDTIPVRNNENREYIEYKKIIFSSEGETITGVIQKAYRIGDSNVIFL